MRESDSSTFPADIRPLGVSIKGVVRVQEEVLLALNERDEWELLGGKPRLHEDPINTVAREIFEESGLMVKVGPLLDCWTYRIAAHISVLIVTYDCPVPQKAETRASSEHQELQWWSVDELSNLRIPDGYRTSIRSALGPNVSFS